MKTLICLGGGVESMPIIQRVKELGYRAVVVDGNPNVPGMAMADEALTASCYRAQEILPTIRTIDQAYAALDRDKLKQYRRGALAADGVLCAAVDAPLACAEVAAAFGLPGLSVEAARLGQDKLIQKIRLSNSSIVTVPSFWEIETPWELNHARFRHRLYVVKPVDSRGGRGVVRLLPGVDPARAYEQAKAHSPTGRVIVEEWLDGPQLSTESIVQDGRVLFTAIGLRNYARLDEFRPYVVEDGFDEPYLTPNPSPTRVGEKVEEVIARACRALDWYQAGAGTVKGDLVIHDDQVYVIELAARLSGGFFASHGHPLAYGVDFVGAAIKAALGYRLEEVQPYARDFVCQRYVFPAPGDIGKTVRGFYTLPENGIFRTWNIRIGQTIDPVTCHPARWGQALSTGRTPDEARARAAAAVVKMKAQVILA